MSKKVEKSSLEKKKVTKAKSTKAKSTKAKSTKAKSTKAKSTKAKSTKAKSTKAKSTKAKSTKAKSTQKFVTEEEKLKWENGISTQQFLQQKLQTETMSLELYTLKTQEEVNKVLKQKKESIEATKLQLKHSVSSYKTEVDILRDKYKITTDFGINPDTNRIVLRSEMGEVPKTGEE